MDDVKKRGIADQGPARKQTRRERFICSCGRKRSCPGDEFGKRPVRYPVDIVDRNDAFAIVFPQYEVVCRKMSAVVFEMAAANDLDPRNKRTAKKFAIEDDDAHGMTLDQYFHRQFRQSFADVGDGGRLLHDGYERRINANRSVLERSDEMAFIADGKGRNDIRRRRDAGSE